MKEKLIVITIAIIVFAVIAVIKLISIKHIEKDVIKDASAEQSTAFFEREVILYYPDNNLINLIKKRDIIISDGYILNDVKKVFDIIKEGYPELTIYSIIPETTLLLSYFINDKILYLNFNSNIIENRGSAAELLFVKSIVYTYLESFPSINKVHFLVENNVVRSLAQSEDYGHIDFSKPFLKNSF